jgi:hypothetical protein
MNKMIEEKLELYCEKSDEKLQLLYQQQKNYDSLDDYKSILELSSINANIFIQSYSYNYDISYDEHFELKDMDIVCTKITADWYSDTECLRTIKLFDTISNKDIGYCLRWYDTNDSDANTEDGYSEIEFFQFPRYLSVELFDELYFNINWEIF